MAETWIARKGREAAEERKKNPSPVSQKRTMRSVGEERAKKRKPEYTPATKDKPLTITVRGGAKAAEPKKTKAPASAKAKTAPKRASAPKAKKDTSWAAKEREGIKKQRAARKGAPVVDKSTKARKLKSAVKPGKGYASYKSLMEGQG